MAKSNKIQLKLPIKNIVEFFELSSKIDTVKNFDHLPTGEYLKIEIIFGECLITKNNIQCFIEYKFDVSMFNIEDIEFLLHEKKTKDFCLNLKGDFIYIQIEDITNETNGDLNKEIIISNTNKFKDSTRKINYNTKNINIDFFPKVEYEFDSSKTKTRIGKDVIDVIAIANKHTSSDSIKPAFTCVYLGSYDDEKRELCEGNICFSSDGLYCHYQKTFNDSIKFKPIAIQQIETRAICNNDINYVDYVVSNSHNLYFFPKGNVIFGFRHIDNTNGFDPKRYKTLCTKQAFVTLNIDDILLFCVRAKATQSLNASTTYIISSCTINKEENTCKLIYKNETTNDEDTKECEIINEKNISSFNDFSLNHNIVYDILKSLPYNTITIHNEEFMLGLTSEQDKDYFGFFAKLQK